MPSASYRVYALGFKCNTDTYDDIFEYDGKGDEVYVQAYVRYVNKNGLVYENQVRKAICGDTNGLPGRLNAGSRSDRGGIRTGDSFPVIPYTKYVPPTSITFPWGTFPLPLPANANELPPWLLWEGSLTEGETEVWITPTLWEWDGGESAALAFLKWQKDIDAEFGMKAKDIVAGVWPPVGPIFDAVSLGIQTVAKLPLLLGQPQDRPFGHVQNADGTVSFNPKGLHFTYDHAETMLAQQPSGRGPGVFEMQFTNSGTPGDYTLYMLIERAPVVPSPPAPPPAAAVGNYVFLGGTLTSGPAVCSRRPGLLDVFARGTDNALRHMTYDQAWGRWEQLDPNPIAASTAAAVSWDAGRIDVFVRGTDDALYTKSLVENQWTGYVGLEGQLTSGPAACSWSAGRIDVFGRGTDEALWHRAYDRTWHPWERLGENKIADSNPAAVSWGPGRIDVFVRGTDSVLYTKSWVGSRWTDYVRLGGPGEGRISSSPTVSSRGEGLLDVFACGTDGAMWHLRYDGGWNPWERLGTEVVSDPAAASWDSNRIDVFVRDVSGQLYTKSWDGTWL